MAVRPIRGPYPPEEREEDGRWDALRRCAGLLEEEGLAVSFVISVPDGRRRDAPPDLIASRGSRRIRVFVLWEDDLETLDTKFRIRASLAVGETRVYVPWRFRWRVLTNLERWRLVGAAVIAL